MTLFLFELRRTFRIPANTLLALAFLLPGPILVGIRGFHSGDSGWSILAVLLAGYLACGDTRTLFQTGAIEWIAQRGPGLPQWFLVRFALASGVGTLALLANLLPALGSQEFGSDLLKWLGALLYFVALGTLAAHLFNGAHLLALVLAAWVAVLIGIDFSGGLRGDLPLQSASVALPLEVLFGALAPAPPPQETLSLQWHSTQIEWARLLATPLLLAVAMRLGRIRTFSGRREG